jgi:hypothetical protein
MYIYVLYVLCNNYMHMQVQFHINTEVPSITHGAAKLGSHGERPGKDR